MWMLVLIGIGTCLQSGASLHYYETSVHSPYAPNSGEDNSLQTHYYYPLNMRTNHSQDSPRTNENQFNPRTRKDREHLKTNDDREHPRRNDNHEHPRTNENRERPRTHKNRVNPRRDDHRGRQRTNETQAANPRKHRVNPRPQENRVDPRTHNRRTDPRTQEDNRVDPRTPDNRVDPRTPDDRVDPRTHNRRTDPRTQEDNRVDPRTPDDRVNLRPQDARVDPRIHDKRVDPRTHGNRVDPRLHETHSNGNGDRYVCPAEFVRHGQSCYFLSRLIATWHDASFNCRDKGAYLARMEMRWEDKNMRTYLNQPELARLERWIGGIYDWGSSMWVWGDTGNKFKYQGFSRRKPNADNRWHCAVMDPAMMYRWGPRSCLLERHYICETALRNSKPDLPEELRQARKAKRREMRRKNRKTNAV